MYCFHLQEFVCHPLRGGFAFVAHRFVGSTRQTFTATIRGRLKTPDAPLAASLQEVRRCKISSTVVVGNKATSRQKLPVPLLRRESNVTARV